MRVTDEKEVKVESPHFPFIARHVCAVRTGSTSPIAMMHEYLNNVNGIVAIECHAETNKGRARQIGHANALTLILRAGRAVAKLKVVIALRETKDLVFDRRKPTVTERIHVLTD